LSHDDPRVEQIERTDDRRKAELLRIETERRQVDEWPALSQPGVCRWEKITERCPSLALRLVYGLFCVENAEILLQGAIDGVEDRQ
jgi:hypothetical protein